MPAEVVEGQKHLAPALGFTVTKRSFVPILVKVFEWTRRASMRGPFPGWSLV